MSLIQNGTVKTVAAIISEYNPFHNGHRYHIEMTRRSGAQFVIAIMSGSTVQRGETAVFDKHFRAKTAVENGIDLVIELPYPYSSSSARDFAMGAVSIIDRLNVVDYLSFGCENNDAELLRQAAAACREISDSGKVSEFLKAGMNYPSAVSRVVCEQYGEDIAVCLSSPNNTLAIEYIRAINELGCDIGIIPIKREGASHDSDDVTDGIASASHIRSLIRSGRDVSDLLPYSIEGISYGDIDKLSDMIALTLLSDEKALDDMPQELAVRVRNILNQGKAEDFSSLIDAVKSKNFTRARIARELLSAYISSVTGISNERYTPHARVLAFGENGRLLLREIEEKCEDITVTGSLSVLSDVCPELAALDNFTSRLQSLSAGNAITNEFSRKFTGFISH